MMHYYLVNTFENNGWGTRIDNQETLLEQALFKNRYRAIKHIKSYGYEIDRGINSKDQRGNRLTLYTQKDSGYLSWKIIEIEVE
jgi:hypothetical protein